LQRKQRLSPFPFQNAPSSTRSIAGLLGFLIVSQLSTRLRGSTLAPPKKDYR